MFVLYDMLEPSVIGIGGELEDLERGDEAELAIVFGTLNYPTLRRLKQ